MNNNLPPAPLTKRKQDGTPYDRPPEIEAALAAILALPREAVEARLGVRDRRDPDFIPSECLVHLLRQTRYQNSQTWFGRLYMALLARIHRALPRADYQKGEAPYKDLTATEIRDRVRDRFQEMLAADLRSPGERLDYFEIRFDHAIAKLRASARHQAWRTENRSEPLEADPETGELLVDVERAAGSLDLPSGLLSDDPGYRKRLDEAIDGLPTEQRRIIEMLRAGMPMDSAEPGTLSIRQVLGCAEKTVRNRRDAAIRALRVALGLEAGR